ncbi:response regulator [Marinifilum sp. N1E240]|uniref:response regulator n=1 Tax=Marinifilum sp. N1E240 TaxID=2608082 RepID=UPI00128BEE43|nr:response regulator [uncultured Marinifilum sp.]MPQ47178.1 response regulator [Marinifilum sp. N1E240]
MKRFFLKFEYQFFLAYLLIGGAWILFSDRIVKTLIHDVDHLTSIQTYKGWFYVLMTGILFFFLLKKHLLKIRNAESKAKESDRLKSAFLQNMSHEIRTPMNGIVGFAGLLKDDDLSISQKEKYLSIITQCSDQLLNVVNDVLDLSLIETGNIEAARNSVSINKILDDYYNTYSATLNEGISLKLVKGLSEEDSVIVTDEVKFRQIVNNLLSNAQKFTENGSIEFGYEYKQSQIQFFVKDSGIGIDSKMHDGIFDRFRRAEIETTKTIGGAGLGLAICRGNTNLLGGKIWVDSTPGLGSSFYFTIPVNIQISDKNIPINIDTDEPIANNNCILIAEDEESNFLYISEILEESNLEIFRAINGQEAIEIYKENKKISLILMDIKMPVLDGYNATHKIREFDSDIPIIAQTAFAMSDERLKALEAGCTDYIAKPFRKNEVLSMIRKYQKK